MYFFFFQIGTTKLSNRLAVFTSMTESCESGEIGPFSSESFDSSVVDGDSDMNLTFYDIVYV